MSAARPACVAVGPSATARFLCRCADKPDRFFYPCNAKHREPQSCVYTLHRAAGGSVSLAVEECQYTEGGTGWRVWPCSLLLACWLARHEAELALTRARVLELGSGLGLPGFAAAALGAAEAVVSDCLPQLLSTLERTRVANASPEMWASAAPSDWKRAPTGGSKHSQVAGATAATAAATAATRVVMLDWDEEAPTGAAADETYSTEAGVKAAQLAGVAGGPCDGFGVLRESEVFDVVLASDVIYSASHALQLPRIISRRLADGGRLCAMVPVRSEAHTRAFLNALRGCGLRVLTSRVDAPWVRRVTALQLQEEAGAEGGGRHGAALADGSPWGEASATVLAEGDILFVDCRRGAGDVPRAPGVWG